MENLRRKPEKKQTIKLFLIFFLYFTNKQERKVQTKKRTFFLSKWLIIFNEANSNRNETSLMLTSTNMMQSLTTKGLLTRASMHQQKTGNS